jgi:hypothetical protein
MRFSSNPKFHWKVVFMEQRCEGTLRVRAEPFSALRVPKLYNLRTDSFERADITSNTYYDWFLQNDFLALAAQGIVADFLKTFKQFPPRQKAASFTIDQAMQKMVSPRPAPDRLPEIAFATPLFDSAGNAAGAFCSHFALLLMRHAWQSTKY